MAKRPKNKILIAVFLFLAIIVAAVWIYDSNKGERSFRSELFEFEPDNATAVIIAPAGRPDEKIRLEKEGEGWNVSSKEKSYPADTAYIMNLLQSILQATPERVAGLDRSSWEEFRVTDSTGTHVVVEEDGDVISDFFVGRVAFSQPPQQQGYGRNQNPIIKSHIRVADDEKVYLVDGYLSLMFNDKPTYYRDKVICRFGQEQPVNFTFSYPGDSSFKLIRAEAGWTVNGAPADSLEVVSYLASVSNSTGNEFTEEEEIAGLTFTHHVKIEGNNMPVIEIEGVKADTADIYYLKSSANPTAVFSAKGPHLFDRIFVSREKFK